MGIQFFYSPTLSKTSFTSNSFNDFSNLYSYLFEKPGVNFPVSSHTYGIGLRYKLNSKHSLSFSYNVASTGQRSGKQYFYYDGQPVDHPYQLHVNLISYQYEMGITKVNTKKNKFIPNYYYGGIVTDFFKILDYTTFIYYDNTIIHGSASYTYWYTSPTRIGVSIGSGYQITISKFLSIHSGLNYKFLSDVINPKAHFQSRPLLGIIHNLEWRNMISFSIY